jgi:Na+-transporting methylmalonyl-CoA/oxaloacetate decarboxylase gamma subunit
MSLTRTAELKAALSSASQAVSESAANAVEASSSNGWNYLALALAITLILFRYYRNNTIKLQRIWFSVRNPGKQFPEHLTPPQVNDTSEDTNGANPGGNQPAASRPLLNENFISGMSLFTKATSKSTKGVPFIAIILIIFVAAMVAMPQIKSNFLNKAGTPSQPATQTPSQGAQDANK